MDRQLAVLGQNGSHWDPHGLKAFRRRVIQRLSDEGDGGPDFGAVYRAPFLPARLPFDRHRAAHQTEPLANEQ